MPKFEHLTSFKCCFLQNEDFGSLSLSFFFVCDMEPLPPIEAPPETQLLTTCSISSACVVPNYLSSKVLFSFFTALGLIANQRLVSTQTQNRKTPRRLHCATRYQGKHCNNSEPYSVAVD